MRCAGSDGELPIRLLHDVDPPQHLNPYRNDAGIEHRNLFRSGGTEIDNPAAYIRAAIIDSNEHRFVVVQVDHPDNGMKRKGFVGGRQGLGIESLAAGGRLGLPVE